MPQKDAGQAMEPPVDSASETWGKVASCVMAALPPDDPPVVRLVSWGFFGIENPFPTFVLKLPKPKASQDVFPMIVAPSSLSF